MILLMQNIQSSLYAIFENRRVKFSCVATVAIFMIFGAFDIPFIVLIVKYDVIAFCDYTVCTFAVLFAALSYCTAVVIQSLN
jgi:hypothetical protein